MVTQELLKDILDDIKSSKPKPPPDFKIWVGSEETRQRFIKAGFKESQIITGTQRL